MAFKSSVIGESSAHHHIGKQLICLRDLTKHRGDCGLSPPQGGARVKVVTSRSATSPPIQQQHQRHSPSGAISARPVTSSRVAAAECDDRSPISESGRNMSPPTSPVAAVMPSLTLCSTSFHSIRPDSPVTSAPSLPPRCTSTSLHQGSPPSPATVTDDTPMSLNTRASPVSGDGPSGKETTASTAGTNQLNKLKRFLSTVQQFADDISPDIGDRVRILILALVNSQLSVEEFHLRLQETTNFPLRPFVVPFLKANLPLLQQELLQIAGSEHRSTSPVSPLPADHRLNLPLTIRPPPERRQHPLWYLGPLTGCGTARVLGGHVPSTRPLALDINANGKRLSDRDITYDESPIDLKMDLLAPVAKRLHVDIPQRSNNEPLPPFVINPVSAGTQLSTNDRRDRMTSQPINNNGVCQSDQHINGVEDMEDDWQNIDTILHSIVQMVDRCRRAMVALKEQCRRDHLTFTTKTSNGGQALRTSPGSDANLRLADDLHLLQVRQLAEEAVNEVKRQAVAELHRAVAAAEVKATVTVTAERARLEKVISEVRVQARQEAFSLLNIQEDSTENCWNCGRKAFETCSGCHRARYCGTFCQHRHWETHHLTCRPTGSRKPQSSRTNRTSSTSPPGSESTDSNHSLLLRSSTSPPSRIIPISSVAALTSSSHQSADCGPESVTATGGDSTLTDLC